MSPGQALERLKNSTNGRLITLRLAAAREGIERLERWQPALALRLAEYLFLTPLRLPANKKEELAIGRAKRFDVTVEGQRVVTWKWGSGPQVLMVHGWSGRGGQLHPYAESLVAAGFSVVTFDGPGHGQSAGRRSSLLSFVRVIKEIDRVIGPFQAVVGHSMGGAAALTAVRMGLAVERAVVVGAPTDMHVALRSFTQRFGLTSALSLRLKARIEQRFGMTWEELNLTAHPAPKDTPVLVVHDTGDVEIPVTEGTALAAAWRTELMVTEGLGHFRILRDRVVARRLTGFITTPRAVPPRLELAL